MSVVRGRERRYGGSWNEYVWVHVCVWWEGRERRYWGSGDEWCGRVIVVGGKGEEVWGIRGWVCVGA